MRSTSNAMVVDTTIETTIVIPMASTGLVARKPDRS